jgi:hypothetical protein
VRYVSVSGAVALTVPLSDVLKAYKTTLSSLHPYEVDRMNALHSISTHSFA